MAVYSFKNSYLTLESAVLVINRMENPNMDTEHAGIQMARYGVS